MGQSLTCLCCSTNNTRVVPLGANSMTLPNNLPNLKTASFHRPGLAHADPCISLENLSKRSSLATISLRSLQTITSVKSNSENATTIGGQLVSSSNNTSQPEPEDAVPGRVTSQQGNSSQARRIGGRQSRVGLLSIFARVPTPKPQKARLMMVKPYQGSSTDIPEEPEAVRICKHGKPLTDAQGDVHEVNCVICERPMSRGGRALTGMIAFRRAEARKRKEEKRLKKQKLAEVQENRRRESETYDNALRHFAERYNKD